ncbi:MAG: acyl-CoA reductase [Bacteroidetes bacterium]|nr:acyl-CoA reductase [Bacteroidota bacterium]
MNLATRIKSFEVLGDRLRRFNENSTEVEILPLIEAARSASSRNPWFTPEHVRIALNNLGMSLTPENLRHWLSSYSEQLENIFPGKKIGVVMAGNIPAVGFHDFLCVLISGHKIVAKLSSSDDVLLPAMADILTSYMPEWHDYISFTAGKLEKFDAIIATGSTNTSKYFEYYFGQYPHIIRKSRNSIAVIAGNEDSQDLHNLAEDIMLFFGMGCRSISKVYVPSGYDFSPLIQALGKYDYFINHHKYCNNYEYNKSIMMISQIPFINTGFLLIKEDRSIASRIAMLHYEYYNSPDEITDSLMQNLDSIQCITGIMQLPIKLLPPGKGQNPALWDYADQVDTMTFLLSCTS